MTEGDLRDVIDDLADRFTNRYRYNVTLDARQALLEPALSHLGEITRGIDEGRITIDAIRNGVIQILLNVIQYSPSIGNIDALAVRQSMQRYCPYLFWC